MRPRRRAVFLVEVLAVLAAVAVGGTLMTLAIASIQRSHKRVADLSNRYSITNDFLRCLSRDVRRGQTATVEDQDGSDLRQVLTIGRPPHQVSYRFHATCVERKGPEGDLVADKRWEPLAALVHVADGRPVAGPAVVSATVLWKRTSDDPPEPDRRFDLAVRCAGEVADD